MRSPVLSINFRRADDFGASPVRASRSSTPGWRSAASLPRICVYPDARPDPRAMGATEVHKFLVVPEEGIELPMVLFSPQRPAGPSGELYSCFIRTAWR